MDLRAILEDHNPWWREPSLRAARAYPIRRRLQREISTRASNLGDRRAAVVLGPRQVGKTVLLMQTADDLLDRGWPPRNLTYFDFSDDRVTEPVTAREVAEVLPVGWAEDHPRALLLDEVRLAPSWARWLKQAVDRGNDRIVVTDSAASLLRDAGRESGQGRWDEHFLEGLSFRELVRMHGRPDESVATILGREVNVLERYLAIGGFPEHAFSDDLARTRRRLRGDIVGRAILRDLAGAVDNPEPVRDLFVYLVQDSGAIFNASGRGSEMGHDGRSVRRWVSLLEDTFLIAPLPRHAARPSSRLRSKPKLYAADHGLLSAFAPDPRQDPALRGKIFEAVVFRHLREAARELSAEISYFRPRENLEVDFVVETPRARIAIEVTSSAVKPRRRQRFRNAAGHLKADRGLIVHGGLVEEPSEDGSLVSLQRFVLDPKTYLEAAP